MSAAASESEDTASLTLESKGPYARAAMDTLRVDVTYRPLRVGWALLGHDIEACRQAARLNYTLWGGRFNPLIPVDRPDHARQLVDSFRVDVILPIGTTSEVSNFAKSFPWLINPFHGENIFVGGPPWGTKANVLDVHNLLSHAFQKREERELRRAGVRLYSWDEQDPLADLFLLQLGQYPPAAEIQIDYQAFLRNAARPKEIRLDPHEAVPAGILSRRTISYFSRHGLERHYSVPAGGWDSPGFFLGTLGDPSDFIAYWNIRAADISLLFVDTGQKERYARLLPAWLKRMQVLIEQRRREFVRHVAVWSRDNDTERVRTAFDGMEVSHCRVSDDLWNGLNIVPPMMHLDTVSTLGIVARESEHPRVSFALNDKPFASDVWFHTQRLIASVNFLGNPLFDDDLHTMKPPYIPELNEFFGRSMHRYDSIRIEPDGRVGIIVDAADSDTSLTAIPSGDLFTKVFGLAGFSATPSSGGLLTRQVVTMVGGLQGGRAFKIPGVRRLLKTFGPTAHFTKRTALQLIGGRDPDNADARFSDHEDLFIEQRPIHEKLTAAAVFSYLVEKGLFRIGRNLTCSHCRLQSWTSIEGLTREVRCDLCGRAYDATRQLVTGEWDYRRSGLLGVEKNAQGAIPVVLTLQQLDANISSLDEAVHSMSLDLTPTSGSSAPCEVDFVWMITRPHRRRTAIILAECKDRGPIPLDEFERDVENLRRVADALPRNRLKSFLLLSKLSPFTREEIELARRLNDEHEARAILLTDRELEPYHVYERTKRERGLEREYASTPEDMAVVTRRIYFENSPPQPASNP
jgi:hypothetical protein